MGQDAASTLEEIEVVRERLGAEIEALEERLPAPAKATMKLVGMATGGGLAGSVLLFALKRLRRRGSRSAPAVAAPVVVQMVPERLGDELAGRLAELDGERVRRYALGAVGLWAALRLMEVRRSRRTERALLAVAAGPRAG